MKAKKTINRPIASFLIKPIKNVQLHTLIHRGYASNMAVVYLGTPPKNALKGVAENDRLIFDCLESEIDDRVEAIQAILRAENEGCKVTLITHEP